MKNEIQEVLNKLWEGRIFDFHYDLLKHCLSFSVSRSNYPDVGTSYCQVVLNEISSIVFDNASAFGNPEYDNFNWEMLEVTSFDYFPDCDFTFSPGYSQIPKKGGVGAYNLLLVIFSIGIYIHAKRLKIDDQEFKLL